MALHARRPLHTTVLSFVLLLLMQIFPAGLSAQTVAPVPAGRFTFELQPGTRFAPSFFSNETERVDLSDTRAGTWWQISNGLALGYGFSQTVSARVRWLPGFVYPSGYGGDEKRRRNGATNVRLSVPVVLLSGEMPPLATGLSAPPLPEIGLLGQSPVRVTTAPIGVIKIRGYDFEKQWDLRRQGEDYVAEHPDTKAHAAGIGVSQLWPVSERIDLTAEEEIIFYFPADYAEQSLSNYEQNLIRDPIAGIEAYETIYYRYRLSGELGAAYLLGGAPGNGWIAKLDLSGWFRPAPIVDDIIVEDTDSFLLSLEPAIELTPAVWQGRTRFELAYSFPLLGKNTDAAHRISFTIRSWFGAGAGDADD